MISKQRNQSIKGYIVGVLLIMEINIEDYLKKFKVFNAKTLFPPNFDNLQKNICPICGRKLYLTKNKKMAYCKSKVKDGFIISGKRLLELGGSIK